MRFILIFTLFNACLQIFSLILNVVYLSWGSILKKSVNLTLDNSSDLDIRTKYMNYLDNIVTNKSSTEYKSLVEFIETAQICTDIGNLEKISKLKLFIDSLEAYNNLIEYSSLAMIPLQLVAIVSIKFCCSSCQRYISSQEDSDDPITQNEKKFSMTKSQIEL